MIRCGQCGGKLARVHRGFVGRFRYLAIYQCKECMSEERVGRRFTFHLGPGPRCPRCGTFRLSRLKERDRIDPMQRGFLSWVEWMASRGQLFHCRYCRLQFYDRRRPQRAADRLPKYRESETGQVQGPHR